MGCMRFKRIDPVEGGIFNDYQFDSSPRRSLSMALGTDPKRFELRKIKKEGNFEHYEVHAASFPYDDTERPMTLRGHLTYETPAARHARLD